MWWDTGTRTYKLLAHSFQQGSDPQAQLVGAYAESQTSDFFGAWDFDLHAGAYGLSAEMEDGSTLTFRRRERPKVFLNKDGSLHSVSNAVLLPSGRSCTFVQRVNSTT
eukprot:COSAG01_NODE_11525_length_1914_cov_10.157576_1_plen_108_part_00